LLWVLPPGAPGAATGAIAIGTAEMSTSTTIIISIATTTLTATSVARAATGNTIRSTAEMLPMGTGKRRINSGVRVLVAQAALAIAQAVELEHDQVVAELVVQVVVPELVLGHQRGLLPAALRTKSVTAVHRRGQVAALAVEDLAEVAETTREPAATEAAAAWEAAVTAVAAVVAVAVE
jgi:hypothetical protein